MCSLVLTPHVWGFDKVTTSKIGIYGQNRPFFKKIDFFRPKNFGLLAKIFFVIQKSKIPENRSRLFLVLFLLVQEFLKNSFCTPSCGLGLEGVSRFFFDIEKIKWPETASIIKRMTIYF